MILLSWEMDAKYTIYYYISPSGKNPVKNFLDSLQETQQAKVLRILQYIEEYGLRSILPHVRKLTGTPLWEIRILGKDNIRVIYVVPTKNTVLVLHGFIKKKQKTPSKELNLALSRHYDWLGKQRLLDK